MNPVSAIAIAETVLRNVQLLEGERFDGNISDAGMILDDLLAFHSAASAFQTLTERARLRGGAQHTWIFLWARKLAENLLALGKTAEADSTLVRNGDFWDLALPSEIILYEQTQGEVALAKKDYKSAELIFIKVFKEADKDSAAAGIRALAGRAQLSLQSGDIRSALSFSQLALMRSSIHIDQHGLGPRRALRHVKLLDLQHRIARLRGDPIKNPEEIQQFLEKAIASFGPVPVIVALKAQFEQGPALGP